jgi:hypothetical protein
MNGNFCSKSYFSRLITSDISQTLLFFVTFFAYLTLMIESAMNAYKKQEKENEKLSIGFIIYTGFSVNTCRNHIFDFWHGLALYDFENARRIRRHIAHFYLRLSGSQNDFF